MHLWEHKTNEQTQKHTFLCTEPGVLNQEDTGTTDTMAEEYASAPHVVLLVVCHWPSVANGYLTLTSLIMDCVIQFLTTCEKSTDTVSHYHLKG